MDEALERRIEVEDPDVAGRRTRHGNHRQAMDAKFKLECLSHGARIQTSHS